MTDGKGMALRLTQACGMDFAQTTATGVVIGAHPALHTDAEPASSVMQSQLSQLTAEGHSL